MAALSRDLSFLVIPNPRMMISAAAVQERMAGVTSYIHGKIWHFLESSLWVQIREIRL